MNSSFITSRPEGRVSLDKAYIVVLINHYTLQLVLFCLISLRPINNLSVKQG